jgi:hypothetical protein
MSETTIARQTTRGAVTLAKAMTGVEAYITDLLER